MITIELRLSILSIVTFFCGILYLIPAVLATILSIVHYSSGEELDLRISAGVVAAISLFTSSTCIAVTIYPHSGYIVTLNGILEILLVACGSVWFSLRIAFKEVSGVVDMQLKLEIVCFITWVFAIILGSIVLSNIATAIYLLAKSTNEDLNNLSEKNTSSSKLDHKPSEAFSATTLTNKSIGEPSETREFSSTDINSISAKKSSECTPMSVGSLTFSSGFSHSPPQQLCDITTVGNESKENNFKKFDISHNEKHVKKHRSSMSLLSFLSQTQVPSKRPSISFKSKPNELIQRLKKEHRQHKSLGAIGLSDIPVGITPLTSLPNSSNRSLGFDSWDVNSIVARDKYFWTAATVESRNQSRNISGSSYQSNVSISPSSVYSRYQINSAGFTKEERKARPQLKARSSTNPLEDQELPQTPGAWSTTDIIESPIEGAIAQYDQERLIENESVNV